jgi:transcriptional regulator with XRE-family HTH domain
MPMGSDFNSRPASDDIRQSRGDRLGKAMDSRGWAKHAALAQALGVNTSTVYRWRTDGPLSLEHAIALCAFLDISLDWLLLGHGSLEDRRLQRFTPDRIGDRTPMPESEIRARQALAAIEAVLPEIFGKSS